MRVQDSNSPNKYLPVWQTLQGFSRHDTSTVQEPQTASTDGGASASTETSSAPIWSVSRSVSQDDSESTINKQIVNKEITPNGLVSTGIKVNIDSGESAPRVPVSSTISRYRTSNLTLPATARHPSSSSSILNSSPRTSTSSLLATPSPGWNRPFSPSFPALTQNNPSSTAVPGDFSIEIPSITSPINNHFDEIAKASLLTDNVESLPDDPPIRLNNMNDSLGILNGSESSIASRRASRKNSMAVLPTFPIPSITEVNNVTSTIDNSEQTPDTPNVFRYRYANRKNVRKRIVQKNGECNVIKANVAKRRRRYLQDIFTTLVDVQWRWTLLVFAMSFLCSWLGFAVIWFLICYFNGDLMEENLPNNQEENNWTPCVTNMIGFTSCFLFSIETQHTIGYGSRYTTEQCPHAVVVMCLQSITGVMIQAFMVGIVFAKLSRPKKRTQTLIFSRNMCMVQRDGQMCLMFRVGDMRKSHIIEAHVRAQLIRRHETEEGEEIPLHMYELDVGYDVGEDRIFFIWPMTIVHKIDENSPLYEISKNDLLQNDFEIVVLLEGVIESTGMTTQARSSYLPDEIQWGYRFEPLVDYRKNPREGFFVDLSKFNNILPVPTPTCSAKELEERQSNASSSTDKVNEEGNEEEGNKEVASSHSSQVSSADPVSPLSGETVATAPLIASRAGSISSVSSVTTKQITNPPPVGATVDGSNDETVNAFLYDPDFFKHLDFKGSKPVHTEPPYERRSLVFPPSESSNPFNRYSSPNNTNTHRRTISHPMKGNIKLDNTSSFEAPSNSKESEESPSSSTF